MGTELTEQAIKRLSFEAIKKINRAVGFRPVTKFGQKVVVNLGKAVPLVGGVVGGTFAICKVAKDMFITGVEASHVE